MKRKMSITGYTNPDWNLYFYKLFTETELAMHDTIYKNKDDKAKLSRKVKITIEDIE